MSCKRAHTRRDVLLEHEIESVTYSSKTTKLILLYSLLQKIIRMSAPNFSDIDDVPKNLEPDLVS